MMPTLLQILQAVAGVLWLLPALSMLPAVLRTWRGTADPIDVIRGPVFFTAVVQVGFSLRWLIWPHALPVMGQAEMSTWAGLYVLSSMCAVGILIGNRSVERLR